VEWKEIYDDGETRTYNADGNLIYEEKYDADGNVEKIFYDK